MKEALVFLVRRGVMVLLLLSAWPRADVQAQQVHPGDDFFTYANADWLAVTSIPAGRDRWTSRNEIDDLTRMQLIRLVDDADSAPAGTLGRMVADFRRAWSDSAGIEARGVRPLQPLFDSIARIRDRAALVRFLAADLGADVDPLNRGITQSSRVLGLAVEPGGLHGEKLNVAILVQGGLGLRDCDLYLDPAAGELRGRYQGYITHLLRTAGLDRAGPRAAAVLELETAVARSHASAEQSGSEDNANHRWTVVDFRREAPGIDWSLFFASARLAGESTFVVWQPSAVKGLAALLASEPLERWQDYLRFQLLHRYADALPRSVADSARALQAAITGQPVPSSRAIRAMNATQGAMSGTIGRLYVERHFSARQKARVVAVAANVIDAFVHRVESATWMTPATRAEALAKLKQVYFGLGYPERWEEYSSLVVRPNDPLGNQRRVEARNYREALARLGQPVDRKAWWIVPQRVGAVLLFQQHAYNFAAGLLQPPRYDSLASEAATYGAIGAIVGHEVSHFVDQLGMDYDVTGARRRWWMASDSSAFQRMADKLVAQFAGYRPFPDLAVNGRTGQVENVADLAGLSAAFDAYRRTLGNRITDQIFVRQQDREFFLGYARSWRSVTSDAGLRAQIANDHHAPDPYRIATVRNLDAWYDAFDVGPGHRLYLDPGLRVRVW
jgi:putative endopeptidase